MKFESKYKTFHSRKCLWKIHLWNGVHVLQGEMSSDVMLLLCFLTHWGRVTHICVSKLAIIGSDDRLLPGQHQAIIWTNAGILLIRPLGTKFSEMFVEIHTFSFKKIHLKMSRPQCVNSMRHFNLWSHNVLHGTTWVLQALPTWLAVTVMTKEHGRLALVNQVSDHPPQQDIKVHKY